VNARGTAAVHEWSGAASEVIASGSSALRQERPFGMGDPVPSCVRHRQRSAADFDRDVVTVLSLAFAGETPQREEYSHRPRAPARLDLAGPSAYPRLMSNERAPGAKRAAVAFASLVAVSIGASWLASAAQRGFGAAEVTELPIRDPLGRTVAGKLFRPVGATARDRRPGVLYVHGYESCRETGVPTALELARRGYVALTIDTLGRGDSDAPWMDDALPGFDWSYGARAAFDRLGALPFVDPSRLALVGHSLGAGICYRMALEDPRVRAVAITGAGFDARATTARPRDMLMVIGRYDEFRDRMTGTRDIAREWMTTPAAKAAFGRADARIGVTYGDFEAGTARRVAVPPAIHVGEPVSRATIAEVVDWIERALPLRRSGGLNAKDQIWPLAEWGSLGAMLAGLFSLVPLALLLLALPPFRTLRRDLVPGPARSRGDLLRGALVNGALMWLYLPCALVVFGIHKYVVHVDAAFPMMVVNVTVFWFFVTNAIGLLLFRRWRRSRDGEVALGLGGTDALRTLALAAALAGAAYGLEAAIEACFSVKFKFVFAFANGLTPHRAWLSLRYLPFLAIGFVGLGLFLHVQLGSSPRRTLLRAFVATAARNLLVVLAPIALLLAVQYVPLLAAGAIPFVGPGGMFVLFVFNLLHVAGVLLVVVPLSTWLHLLTGRPWLGAATCALLVAWMFASTQVIAPIPVG
jgi:dienelactone hydrolase